MSAKNTPANGTDAPATPEAPAAATPTIEELKAAADAAKAALAAAKAAAKSAKLGSADAKRALARKVADAIAAALAEATDEERQTVANWVHHLPTGADESGARYWPTTLPKPERSDWAPKAAA